MFKLADLFVSITGNDKPLNATLAAVKGNLLGVGGLAGRASGLVQGGLGAAFRAVGGAAAGLATGAAVGVAAIGAAVAKAIPAASDLNETLNKVGVIFGESAGVVGKAADDMADKFGIVKMEFMDASSEIGNLLQGMGGMTASAAAEMSVSLSKAAADAGSIFNKGFGESIEKIGAAIRGQSEPISAFGVDVQEAAVKAEALRMGLAKGNRELTTQEKVAARASLVIRGLKVAEGDLANTQGGFANASRALWGRLENIFASFGQAIMPIAEAFVGQLNGMLRSVQRFVDMAKPHVESFSAKFLEFASYVRWAAGQVVEAAQGLGQGLVAEVTSWEIYRAAARQVGAAWEWLKGVATEVFESIGVVFRNFSLIGAQVGIRARQLGINIVEAFQYAGEVAGTFAGYVANNWRGLIADGLNAAWAVFQSFGENIKGLFSAVWEYLQNPAGGFHFEFKPLLDGFQATVEKFPEIARPAFTDLSGELAEIMEQMVGREVERLANKAKTAVAAASGAGGARPGRVKPGEAPAKESKAGGSTDLEGFYKRLQESGMKDKAAERTAKATENAAATLKDLPRQIGVAMARQVGAVPGVAT